MAGEVRSDIALLFRRGGFGLSGPELDQLASHGYAAAVDVLLGGLTAPDAAGDAVAVPHFTPFTPLAAQRNSPEAASARKARQAAVRDETAALQQWWLDRMIVTNTPIREKLTLFWHGHFATGASKVRDAKLMYTQNQLFRAAGGGSFEKLVQAVAKDGAMMLWLDTNTDKKAHPNENFARELMELFTLGIGNYTQADVTAAARAFTGWVFDHPHYQYRFVERQHDLANKTYLGHSGDLSGEDVISIAVHHPASAQFIVAKLWSHFAYPVTPSDPIVSSIVDAYGSGLDITAALRAMFLHPQFRSSTTRQGLLKQPAEWLVGAARALRLDARLQRRETSPAGSSPAAPNPKATLARLAGALGQVLFDPPNVGGWGQNSYWLSTATAEMRFRAALLMARSADLTAVEQAAEGARLDAVAEILGLDGWGSTTAAALKREAARPAQLIALALVSPEYLMA